METKERESAVLRVIELSGTLDSDGVGCMLRKFPDVLSWKCDLGIGPLHWWATKGNGDAVRLLLAHGANVNGRDVNGCTPLMTCTYLDDTHMAGLLLEHGADPNATDLLGNSPMIEAIDEPDVRMVELLLSKNADPNIQHALGLPAVEHAICNDEFTIVKLLLQYGAEPDMDFLLCGIYRYPNIDPVVYYDLLLGFDVDLLRPDKDGNHPIFLALEEQNEIVVNYFVQKGVSLGLKDRHGESIQSILARLMN
ncbi:MAG: ankyrin repeat domain-containing protein [Candidatus Hydrogenedentes bacterium]|nr:ankyrin repeat domain-containing protein [Candidatus Hydrogenedentota bacterium]